MLLRLPHRLAHWRRLPRGWLKVPPALPDDTAPSASLDHLRAQAAPEHPRLKPEPLGSLPRPQEPCSGRSKVEDFPLSTSRPRRPGARRWREQRPAVGRRQELHRALRRGARDPRRARRRDRRRDRGRSQQGGHLRGGRALLGRPRWCRRTLHPFGRQRPTCLPGPSERSGLAYAPRRAASAAWEPAGTSVPRLRPYRSQGVVLTCNRQASPPSASARAAATTRASTATS